MGALVGGVYAAGKLDAYRDWVKPLQRFDVLRLLDWTFSGGGLIKGDRIIDKLRELIGEINIEDLPISYTAVAVDLMAQREVWFSRGPLVRCDPRVDRDSDRAAAAPLRGPHAGRRRPAQSGADHADACAT